MHAPSTSSFFLAVTVSLLAGCAQRYHDDGNMHRSCVHVHSTEIIAAERHSKSAAQQHVRHAAKANCAAQCP